MKLKIIKYLIIGFITILSVFMLKSWYYNYQLSKTPIVRYEQKIEEKQKYIITQDTILSNLKIKSKIVSLEQDLHKKETMVDTTMFGERNTEIIANGSFKMGMDTKDVKIVRFDSSNLSVTLKLPKPTLISLDIPFDKVDFDKTKGFARLSMNEEEEKKFYKSTKKIIEKELMNDKNLLEQADLYNQKVVEDLVKSLGIKNVYFE